MSEGTSYALPGRYIGGGVICTKADRQECLLALRPPRLFRNRANKAKVTRKYDISDKMIQRDLEALCAHYTENSNGLVFDYVDGQYHLELPVEMWLTKSEILAVCKILLESRAFTQSRTLNKLVVYCLWDLKAIRECCVVTMDYIGTREKNARPHRVWPVGILFSGYDFYLVACKRVRCANAVSLCVVEN